MKDINIVFLNFFSKDDILRAVDSVFKDTQNSSFDIKITVTDSSQNKDGVKEVLKEKFGEKVEYIDCGGNFGFGHGCNIGFASTEARYYCTLNPDTVIPENSHTIETIINFLDNNKIIGGVGPKLLNLDGSLQYSCYRFDLPSILIKPFKHINLDKKYAWVRKHADKLEMKDFDHNETRPVDWIMGSAMIVRKEAADKVGFFDDRFFMYMEDSDWCRRLWEAGYPVYYLHDVVIHHVHKRDSAKTPGIFKALIKNKLARIHMQSWVKYLWKWRNNHKYYAA